MSYPQKPRLQGQLQLTELGFKGLFYQWGERGCATCLKFLEAFQAGWMCACPFEMVNSVAEFFSPLWFSEWMHSNLVACFQNHWCFPSYLRERWRNSAQSIMLEESSVRSPCRVRTPARCKQKWKRSSLPQVLGSFSPSRRALSHATRLENKFLLWMLEGETRKRKKKGGKNRIHFLKHRVILLLWLYCLDPSVQECWVFRACVETPAGPAILFYLILGGPAF